MNENVSDESLYQAVENDDLEKTEQILKSGADPNEKQDGTPIIIFAKSIEMTKLLIRYKSIVPRQILSDHINDIDFIKFCLDNGFDSDEEDGILIRLAVKNNNLNLLKMLFDEYGALSTINKAYAPLMLAGEMGNMEIMDYLISKGLTKDFGRVMKWVGNSSKLSKDKKLEILDRLQSYIDSGKVTCREEELYRVGTKLLSLQEILKKYGNMKNYVLDWMKSNSSTTMNENTEMNEDETLSSACKSGDLDKVENLLKSGSDPNVDDEFPVRYSINKDNLKLLKLLVDYGAKLSEVTPMHAAENGSMDIVDYLISKGLTDKYDRVMKWAANSYKLSRNKKMEILDRLQSYIDSGKITCCKDGYRIKGEKMTISLQEVLKRYGNIKNYVLSYYDIH